MITRTEIRVATTCLALLLAAGCSGDASSPDPGLASGPPPTPSSSPSSPSSPGPADTPAPTSSPGEPATTSGGSAVTFATLTGQSTRLTVDASFLSALRRVGGDLTAVQGAQTEDMGGATTFVFPVTGGQATVDATGTDRFTGTVQHEGGLRLSALGKSVTVDGLVLDGQQDQLTAMVAGRRVPLLPLSTSDAQITRQGDQVVITDSAVSLDADAANALTGELGLPTLPDLKIGSLQVTLAGS